MTISKVATIVSTGWLRQHLYTTARSSSKVTDTLRILDTSWMPEPEVDGYKQFYQEAHIPTAKFFDLKKISPPIEGSTVKFAIPDSNFFKDYVEELGISNHTHVVAYDRFNSRPSFRAWFLFRLFGHDKVSVLNGGIRQWLTDMYQVTTHEPTVERGEFDAKFRPELLRDYQSMMKNTESQTDQVMDARKPHHFYIGDEEDDLCGHIPGSKNIPFDSVFYENGTVKSEEDLKTLFTHAGVDLSKPLVSSCQSGMTACALIAAAYILGKEDVPLYNGSFHEWSNLSSLDKIAKIKKS